MHPLLEQLDAVGRRAQRLVLCRAVTVWACVILGAMVAAGFADYWLRYSEIEMRWMASTMVAAIAIWMGVRLIWPVVRIRRDAETVAHWVERRFPELQDRLSSAVDFVTSPTDDPRFGSAKLRDALVQEASTTAAATNMHDCLDRRPVQRAGWILLAVSALVSLICAADVQSATIAVRRMVMPWSDESWPRRTWLMFTKHPEVIAVGQDFDAEVIDRRGWLPSDVKIVYWFDGDDESDARVHPMIYAGGKMTHHLAQVTRSFKYRAIGGDDQDMKWIQLVTVEAPRITNLKIELHPPAYSGLPPSTASDGRIRGLVGTALRMTGETSAPIRSVEMHLQRDESTLKIPGEIPRSGLVFRWPAEPVSPYILERSGRFAWAMVDREGVSNSIEFNGSIDAVADAPPTIVVHSPLPDASITAQAVVKFQLTVKDDLAVQSIQLEIDGKTQTLLEHAAPSQITGEANWPTRGEQITLEHSMKLGELGDHQPGYTIAGRFTASDFSPQPSQPVEFTLKIISPEEFKRRLDERQSLVLQRVREALRSQRDIHRQLQTQSENLAASATPPGTLDAISVLDPAQRRVREMLAGEQGAMGLIAQLLTELESNLVDDLELHRHLLLTETELRSIVGELLPGIESQLGDVAKLARSPEAKQVTGPSSGLSVGVSQTLERQEQAIEGLEQIVDRLSQWNDYRLFAQDVSQILDEQQQLVRETQTLSSVGRDAKDLSTVERSKLRDLNDRQRDLASRIDRLHQRLERMRQRLGDKDQPATATLSAALDVLREREIASQMQAAAGELTQNRVGAAQSLEQSAVDSLTQLWKVLSHQVEQDPTQIIQELRSIAEQVDRLREEQAAALARATEAERQNGVNQRSTLDEVARQERQLVGDVEKLVQRLQRLPGKAAARSLTQAMQEIATAEQSAKAGDAASARRSAEEAHRQLAEAAKQLASDQQSAQKAEVDQQLRSLEGSLNEYLVAERALHDRTKDLVHQVEGKSEFSSEQAQQANAFAEEQLGLSVQVTAAEQSLGQANLFTYALQRIADNMQRAGQRLGKQSLDRETIDLQAQAITRLERLLAALSENPHDTTDPPEDLADQSDQSKNESPSQSRLAELRLLRAWQQEINERTDALITSQGEMKSLTPPQLSELEELIAEQKKLAEFVEGREANH